MVSKIKNVLKVIGKVVLGLVALGTVGWFISTYPMTTAGLACIAGGGIVGGYLLMSSNEKPIEGLKELMAEKEQMAENEDAHENG